jgi:beta-glucosidase
VLATLKHFVGHSFSEGARNHAPVRVGERELNDVFLLPFEMAVKLANAGSVMPAYHDIDGEPASASVRYMTDVLRAQWGFDGIIVSDYEAVRLLHDNHRVARDEAEATALALKAGMDIELPGFSCFRTGIEKALARGLIEPGHVDAAVRRVLVEKSRLGLFEHPYADEGAVVLNAAEHKQVAAEAAEKSIVLLANDGILPLRDEGTTALIGPLVDDPLAVFCGYSFPVHLIMAFRHLDTSTRYAKTLREAIGERARSGKLVYSRGCDILTERPAEAPVFPGDPNAALGQKKSYVSRDESRIAEAVRVASKADRIVVALGDLSGLFLTGTVGEGSDASSLELPGVQQKLLDSLLALDKPLVVVLLNGRPYNLGPAYVNANAVLEAFLPGQEGADAIARVLYGDAEPGGRLPVSVPRSAGAMPYFYNHKLKSAGTPVQPEFGAVYPFGHGLSYTTFEYGDLRLESREVPVDGQIILSFTVRNTGSRTGDEVAQLYVRDLYASVVRPIRELKGFKRLTLAPGEGKTLRFTLPADMLAFTVSGTTRLVEPGEIELMVGRSSQDVRLSDKVTLTGSPRALPRDWRMVCATEVVSA